MAEENQGSAPTQTELKPAGRNNKRNTNNKKPNTNGDQNRQNTNKQ